MWITIATMQFDGAAARWLQSIQHKLPHTPWEEFCSWTVTRFGRNQHQTLLRQLYHIHQSSSVVDYVDRFAELIDQLTAYEIHIDTIHYTTRFIDGLKPHIRVVIAIQCPQDLDTAYSLALLQEEVGEALRPMHQRPQLQLPQAPPLLALPALPRRPHHLPSPPSVARPTLQPEQPIAGEIRSGSTRSASTDDKWAALRAYRKARGLCFTCGERWARDHQCKGTVQLHVIQEILGLFPPEETEHEQSSASESSAELQLLTAVTAIKDPSTLTFQLTGVIQGQQVQFLVDSGSTHSFLNSKFLPQFSSVQTLPNLLQVKVANGQQLLCTQALQDCP
jgi:hypothetical protein